MLQVPWGTRTGKLEGRRGWKAEVVVVVVVEVVAYSAPVIANLKRNCQPCSKYLLQASATEAWGDVDLRSAYDSRNVMSVE
jgi:anti-sigma-K factor RskA